MSTVHLQVRSSDGTSKSFALTEHDTFLLGSMNGTHINFSKPVSDVWSFAASLYQLLTGKFPYRFDPKRDPIDIILNENPVPIRDRMLGLAFETPIPIFRVMSAQSAFQRGVSPLLQLLLPGREDAVLSVQTDQSLRERID